ncbi:MAG: DUF4091 domain-containing protein [Chloroflexota bacterium]
MTRVAFALAPALWKAPRDTEIPECRDLAVPAARREVVGAQLLIRADEPVIVTTDGAAWRHPLGRLPRVRVEVDAPGEDIVVETFVVAFARDDHGIEWPESLDRAGFGEVAGGTAQPVYVRIAVAADAAAGRHDVAVRAFVEEDFADERPVWSGSIAVEVAAVKLPEPRDFAIHLDLWQHLTAIARHHGVPLWSDAHLAIVDRYYASLEALGQKAVTLVVTDDPWAGWHGHRDQEDPAYMAEHSIVGVRRAAFGELVLDFSVVDRVLELAARHGMDREIEVFGLIGNWTDAECGFVSIIEGHPDAVRIRVFDEGSGAFTWLRTRYELATFVRALRDHFAALGVLDRVRIAADEPSDPARLAASLAFVDAAAPGVRYKLAITDTRPRGAWPEAVTDFSLGLVPAARDDGEPQSLVDECHARGGRASFYLCAREVYPNTFLHSALAETELVGWLTHRLGLDGFLRWAYSLWPRGPMRETTWRAWVHYWPAGDTYFVLPGPDGAPIPTLRYEALRAAVQDFELLRLVERTLPAEEARGAIAEAQAHIFRTDDARLFSQVGSLAADVEHTTPPTVAPEELYSTDPEDYAAARRVLLAALETFGDVQGS